MNLAPTFKNLRNKPGWPQLGHGASLSELSLWPGAGTSENDQNRSQNYLQ